MQLGVAVIWVLAAVVVGLLVTVAVRTVYMAARAGIFPAWVMTSGDSQFKRGFAVYGQRSLAWHPRRALTFKARYLLPRSELEVLELGAPGDSGVVTLTLAAPDRTYTFALLQADAEGVISWVSSAPPKDSSLLGH